jgi:uncharacterized SAM-binding protein YcdF (DUF218 family)
VKQTIKYLSLLCSLFYFAACITPKKGPRKKYTYAKENLKPFDAIIVPGIPFNNGVWDSVMKARLIWATVLYKEGMTKNIIFSGAAVYSPYPEAKIMGLYAEKMGVPRENIFYDTLARHSTENVYYSYLLAKKIGFKSLALATDPFQAGLLNRFLRRRFGTPVYPLPFITDTLGAYNHVNPIIEQIDYESFKVNDFISITETENIFTRLKGTLGRDIDWKQYEDGKLDPL